MQRWRRVQDLHTANVQTEYCNKRWLAETLVTELFSWASRDASWLFLHYQNTRWSFIIFAYLFINKSLQIAIELNKAIYIFLFPKLQSMKKNNLPNAENYMEEFY